MVKGNKQYYDTISAQFSSVSSDLQGLNAHRYARQISGGCQEYIEAASFEHYLQTAKILPYADAAAQMKQLDPDGPGVELSPEDYLLGIYDMTGELMRFAVTSSTSCRQSKHTETSADKSATLSGYQWVFANDKLYKRRGRDRSGSKHPTQSSDGYA